MREDDKQQRNEDRDENRTRENRIEALRIAERVEDKIIRAEENMQRMLMTMLTHNNQQL